jgi:hypothetical protein
MAARHAFVIEDDVAVEGATDDGLAFAQGVGPSFAVGTDCKEEHAGSRTP